MSSVQEVTTLFAAASASFAPIIGPPTDDDIMHLREALLGVLFSIQLVGEAAGCPSGVILDDAAYLRTTGSEDIFDPMREPLAVFNPAVGSSTKGALLDKKTAVWQAKHDNKARINACDRGARDLILKAVEDTWVRELRSPDTYYARVPPRDLLLHLSDRSGGLERPDVVALLAQLPTLWAADPRVPEYINALEESQKKSVRAELPISDDLLAAFASSSLLAENSFPTDRPAWDGKPPAEQTWAAWKATFLPLHKAMERGRRAATGRADTFGSASAAILVHGTSGPSSASPSGSPHLPFADVVGAEQMDQHFDALAAAATASSTVIEQLVSATTAQYAEIKDLLQGISGDLPSAATAGTTTSPPASNDAKKVATYKKAIQQRWMIGGFCSTHGFGVGYKHTSANCKEQCAGHIAASTRANPRGPGARINVGWDKGLAYPTPRTRR